MLSIEIIGSAFFMGLAGSLHCIGMCGPLALSIPVSHDNEISRLSGGLLYNAGRVISYTLLGLLFGSFGDLIIITDWQNNLSIALGIIIFLYLLTPKKFFQIGFFKNFTRPLYFIRKLLGRLLQSKKYSSTFFIGVINGFLPCGLVYLALTSSLVAASPVNGMTFMLFFGLGTFPLMISTVMMGNYLNQTLRMKTKSFIPVLLSLMALLLVLRGLHLGIPYLSPEEVSSAVNQTVSCYK